MLKRLLIHHYFSKISKQSVLSSNYEQLTNMIALKYGRKQLKHTNAACIYEIDHNFGIFREGGYVLDIGAGPHFHWTDIAINGVENGDKGTNVVSNDILEVKKLRPNHVFIQGDFMEEQVKTKIALALDNKKFDTILVDMSPKFTDNLNEDGAKIVQFIEDVFKFSHLFLEKGGNIVCKVLQCPSTADIELTGKVTFGEFNKFIPSVVRRRSPVAFYVMKGFMMNYQHQAMENFISKYTGTPQEKIQIVKGYQQKRYVWNPVDVIKKKVKENVIRLRNNGVKDAEIVKIFQNDPFADIVQIINLLNKKPQKKINKNQQFIRKALFQFTGGDILKSNKKIPYTREEWIQYLQEYVEELKSKKNNQKERIANLQPLGDEQIYIKEHLIIREKKEDPIYLEADLLGEYSEKIERKYLDSEIEKMKKKVPEKQGKLNKLKKNMKLKQKDSLQDVFKLTFRQQKRDQQENTVKFLENLKKISEEQFQQKIIQAQTQQNIDDFKHNRVRKVDRKGYK